MKLTDAYPITTLTAFISSAFLMTIETEKGVSPKVEEVRLVVRSPQASPNRRHYLHAAHASSQPFQP